MTEVSEQVLGTQSEELRVPSVDLNKGELNEAQKKDAQTLFDRYLKAVQCWMRNSDHDGMTLAEAKAAMEQLENGAQAILLINPAFRDKFRMNVYAAALAFRRAYPEQPVTYTCYELASRAVEYVIVRS
jgi:hypothetical protein